MIRTKPGTPEYSDSWERVFNTTTHKCTLTNTDGEKTEYEIKTPNGVHIYADAVPTEECKCTTTCSAVTNAIDISGLHK